MKTNLSLRGSELAQQKPVFLDILSDAWDPVSNPEGVVNIGLAENVGRLYSCLWRQKTSIKY